MTATHHKTSHKTNHKTTHQTRPSSYHKFYRSYLRTTPKLQTYQKIGIIFLIVVISGFAGWIYEFFFYALDAAVKAQSFQGLFMQGGNFLPWINIYAIGALTIIFTTYKIRRHPWAVFLISILVTGIIELLGGWLIYTIGDGTRYWDYNTEILNFGNIGGFVCLRSVLCFGVSALLLMYLILPFCAYLSQKLSRRAFLVLAITLFSLVMLDELGNLTAKILSLPTAMDFYRAIGFRYVY